jgi:uncharacterized protein YjiS (DUF1127 family)
MSFYELDRPATSGLVDRIKTRLTALSGYGRGFLDSMAYARMMSVMYRMDDSTLERIGITRADIPAYVDRCLNRDR